MMNQEIFQEMLETYIEKRREYLAAVKQGETNTHLLAELSTLAHWLTKAGVNLDQKEEMTAGTVPIVAFPEDEDDENGDEEDTVHEMAEELRQQDDVIAVIVWQKADLVKALQNAGYIATEERIDELWGCVEEDLEDCSDGWSRIEDAIWEDCDFGDSDYDD